MMNCKDAIMMLGEHVNAAAALRVAIEPAPEENAWKVGIESWGVGPKALINRGIDDFKDHRVLVCPSLQLMTRHTVNRIDKCQAAVVIAVRGESVAVEYGGRLATAVKLPDFYQALFEGQREASAFIRVLCQGKIIRIEK